MINPALVDNYLAMKHKRLLLVEQPDEFLMKNLQCTVSGSWFEDLSKLVESLQYVNHFRLPGLK
jgi:hypothetical protein